jgi:hypothetical protein
MINRRTTFGFLTILNVVGLLYVSGCGGGGDPAPPKTESQKATEIMTQGTWTMQSVSVDGADKTSIYAGLKITFTSTGFSASNGGGVWPNMGTWQFTDNTGKTMKRDDGLTITLTELTDKKMVLTLTWRETTLGGRESSVEGSHVFTFGK